MEQFEKLNEINEKANAGRFKDSFDNICENFKTPEWFTHGKLGIFIHWGPYAVPAFKNEWYPRLIYVNDRGERNRQQLERAREFREFHEKTYGPVGEFGYKDLIPKFKAENWDPEEWAALFAQSGAQYVVPVAEHHDGFPMYDCPYTEWNAAKMGPERDVIQELSAAVRATDLKFGVSTHRAFNWRFFTHDPAYDNYDPQYAGLYGQPHPPEAPPSLEFLVDWLRRTWDLIDRFQPDLLYFDFGWQADEFREFRPKIFSYYYNRALEWGKDVLVNFKAKCPLGAGVWDLERGQLDGIQTTPWQTDTSLGYNSWSHIEDEEFRTPARLIHDLADIVSKNGNLLINVGPRADGVIPAEPADLLRRLGDWLKLNGEAIYGAKHWHTYGEGPTQFKGGFFSEKSFPGFTADDVRYTVKDNALYAIVLGEPRGAVLLAEPGKDLDPDAIENVSLLGGPDSLKWTLTRDCLIVEPPADCPGKYAVTFKIEFKNAAALAFDEIKTPSTVKLDYP